MIERVIENWLDSTTEREYQLPFSQVLAAEGFRIIHTSSHGPTEEGKDIICLSREGTPCAFQLKTGNINLRFWRDIRGEVEELVLVPIQHPNIPANTPFRAYLVTNGVITDPVRIQITNLNRKWEARGEGKLEILQRGDLYNKFVRLHGEFLPATPSDFERFLRLFLSDKKAPLDKTMFAEFLESFLPLDKDIKRAELRRVFAATAVLANYVLSGFQREKNHHAVAEGWIVVIAYLLKLAEKIARYEPVWLPSLKLCIEAWERATESLVTEALTSANWVEGDLLTDHAVHPHRKTMLLGYLSVFALYKKAGGNASDVEGEILKRITTELKAKEMPSFWGESATPYFYALCLFLLSHGQEEMACQLTASLVKSIAEFNGGRVGLGMPDPYYDPESLLNVSLFRKDIFSRRQSFRGRSYSLRILVKFLTRRERKRLLKSLWHRITRVDFIEFVPEDPTDTYRWRVKRGSLVTRRWNQPENWADLLASATEEVSRQILLTKQFDDLILPFLLVYPHRMSPSLARIVENAALVR